MQLVNFDYKIGVEMDVDDILQKGYVFNEAVRV
jgi:hypothetical protein